MVRQRGKDRWSGTADHEGKRHHGRSHRSAHREEEGRVSAYPPFQGTTSWLVKKLNSELMRGTRCCAESIFSTTRSRSRSAPRAATSCSTSHSARPASPRTA